MLTHAIATYRLVNSHIGIYTRILLTFLLDPTTRPTAKDMKLWVDIIRFIKRGAQGGALGFFTYMELSACQSYPYYILNRLRERCLMTCFEQ